MRRPWNVQLFNQVNLPEVIGTVNADSFSEQNNIRVLDMPIYMPGQGWAIPGEITQFLETIRLAVMSERRYGHFEKDHYVYITVDQKVVREGKTSRRAGAHSDAYIEFANQQIDITDKHADVVAQEHGEVSHTYIIYDSVPTEFFNAPFPLVDSSDAGSLKTFDEIAATAPIVTYPTHTLLRLDPYVVHRCAVVPKDHYRTFVKVSISKKKYARQGNTINPEFKYDWTMGVRSPSERNTPWNT